MLVCDLEHFVDPDACVIRWLESTFGPSHPASEIPARCCECSHSISNEKETIIHFNASTQWVITRDFLGETDGNTVNTKNRFCYHFYCLLWFCFECDDEINVYYLDFKRLVHNLCGQRSVLTIHVIAKLRISFS